MKSVLVSIDTVNNGAIIDLFNEEFPKLLQNIADDNTEATKERSITIKLTVKPSKDRSRAETRIDISSKLAPIKANESSILFSSDGKKIQAYSQPLEIQDELEFADHDKIVPIGTARG